MNNVRKSVVEKIPRNSTEFAVVQTLCDGRIIGNGTAPADYPGSWPLYRKVLLDVNKTIVWQRWSCQLSNSICKTYIGVTEL